MTSSPSQSDLPDELLRLRPRERKIAVAAYNKLMERLNAERPDFTLDNQRRALNSAYSAAARNWLGSATLFAIPGSILWSLFSIQFVPTLILVIITGGVFCFSFIPNHPGPAILSVFQT